MKFRFGFPRSANVILLATKEEGKFFFVFFSDFFLFPGTSRLIFRTARQNFIVVAFGARENQGRLGKLGRKNKSPDLTKSKKAGIITACAIALTSCDVLRLTRFSFRRSEAVDFFACYLWAASFDLKRKSRAPPCAFFASEIKFRI